MLNSNRRRIRPLSRGTRWCCHKQMIVVGYRRISDREKPVASAISTKHLARRTRSACSDRNLVRWTPLLRYLALIVGVSTGCADDVAMTNPRTGMTQICQESLGGLNPWSQTMACVANYEAQGWRRANR
jgi:hypothetical protein